MIKTKINNINDYKNLCIKLINANLLSSNAVYCFKNKNDYLYIGYSSSIGNRLYNQTLFIEDLLLSKQITEVNIYFYETTKEAQSYEKIFIFRHKPIYNSACTNQKAKMMYYIPFEYRSIIQDYYIANKTNMNSPSDVIIKMCDEFFKNQKQLKLC
jgi:excinuclease UvrABC nuclease subunit